MTTKDVFQTITSQACSMFSDYLERIGCKSNILIIVAPVNCARDVTAASNRSDVTAKLIARTFLNSRNDYTRQLVQELPRARPMVPELPAKTDVHLQLDNQTVIVCTPDKRSSPVLHAAKAPVDLSEMVAQACEQIIDLFETNGLEMDCFIAIAHPLATLFDMLPRDAVTAASTASSTSTDVMLHSYIRSSRQKHSNRQDLYLGETDDEKYDE
jgi:hypothetical protein